MGVRGKLEAVIYAAEEPVTLAQLSALFGEEALAESERLAIHEEAPEKPDTANVAPAPEAVAADPDVPADLFASEPVIREPEPPHQAHGEPVRFGDPDADKRAIRLRNRAAQDRVAALLNELIADYDADGRGMELREIAGGYQIATRPEYHDAVRAFTRSLKPPMKLSLPALETLAVIAYKQPVTAPEISEIRGVDSGGVLGSLISRKLVTTAGRKQVIGRPILYKTTREFLLRFGLKDIAELPSMEEFEKMAGELESMNEEPVAEVASSSDAVQLPVGTEESEGQ